MYIRIIFYVSGSNLVKDFLNISDEVMKDLLAQQKARMRPRVNAQSDQSETVTNTADQSESSSTATDESQSSECSSTTENPINGRAQVILQKYLDKIKETESEISKTDVSGLDVEELLKVVEGPGNARQLSFKITDDVDLKVNQIYDELVKLLMG